MAVPVNVATVLCEHRFDRLYVGHVIPTSQARCGSIVLLQMFSTVYTAYIYICRCTVCTVLYGYSTVIYYIVLGMLRSRTVLA